MLDEADDGDLTQGGYVTYGTPVDIPEADEAAKKRVPVQDQVATDEQGRRRFHGAYVVPCLCVWVRVVASAVTGRTLSLVCVFGCVLLHLLACFMPF